MFGAVANYVASSHYPNLHAISEVHSSLGYGIGVFLRGLFDRVFGSQNAPATPPEQPKIVKKVEKITPSTAAANDIVPFSELYDAFTKPIRIIRIGDGNLGDLVEGATDRANFDVLFEVATVGHANIRAQAINNTLIGLQLTGSKIPVYPGEAATLAIGNNTQEIQELEQQILDDKFYGPNGLQGLPFPAPTTRAQPTPGYQKIVQAIRTATPLKRVTFMVTSPLTVVAKAFEALGQGGSWHENIEAIIFRGVCLKRDPGMQCNAPDTMPDDQKYSEFNVNSDIPAAQQVIKECRERKIKLFIIPLETTQDPLWTASETKILDSMAKMDNVFAAQMESVSKEIPRVWARRCPPGTYYLNDPHNPLNLPDFYSAENVDGLIGNGGEFIQNSTTPENERSIYIISIPQEKKAAFWGANLKPLEKFNCPPGSNVSACQPDTFLTTFLEIAIPAGVGLVGLTVVGVIIYKKRALKGIEEKGRLLASALDQQKQRAPDAKSFYP